LLFVGTIIALVVGEVQRRDSLKTSDAARKEQYEQDKALNDASIADLQEERANQARLRAEDSERRRTAGLAQLVTILQAYQRAINLLLMKPHYPIAAHARTMESLLSHALSDNVVAVIPAELRNTTISAIIKAQETLQASADNQNFHESLNASLQREAIIVARFSERVVEANDEVNRLRNRLAHEMDPRAQALLQQQVEESERRLSSLKASPDSYDSTNYIKTGEERTKKLAAIYPMITENAEDAARVLIAARKLLGDDVDMTFTPAGRTT